MKYFSLLLVVLIISCNTKSQRQYKLGCDALDSMRKLTEILNKMEEAHYVNTDYFVMYAKREELAKKYVEIYMTIEDSTYKLKLHERMKTEFSDILGGGTNYTTSPDTNYVAPMATPAIISPTDTVTSKK